jgi:anthranilate synthase
MHGKASTVRLAGDGGLVLAGMPETFEVGRYHSLFADTMTLPRELTVTAATDDGVIMALEHESLPIAGVQFHPESIMSAGQALGLQIVRQAVSRLRWEA